MDEPAAKAGLELQTPAQSAARLLAVIDALTPAQTGWLIDHKGLKIEF
jgi:hypothetical protein